MHVHLDHDHCLESVILKGPTAAVRGLAGQMRRSAGVRHGASTSSPSRPATRTPRTAAHQHRGHVHLIPTIADLGLRSTGAGSAALPAR